jgi:hypothetical protein
LNGQGNTGKRLQRLVAFFHIDDFESSHVGFGLVALGRMGADRRKQRCEPFGENL